MTQRVVTTVQSELAAWRSAPRKEIAQTLFTAALVALVAAITVLALAL